MSQTRVALWQTLQEQGLVQGDMPHLVEVTPWYVRVMLGIAGWIAALHLLAFLGVAVANLLRRAASALALGAVCCAGAYAVIRQARQRDFLLQFGLALSLAGQAVVMLGLYRLTRSNWSEFYFLVFAFELILALAVPLGLHRLLCSAAAAVALWFFLATAAATHSVVTGLVAGVMGVIWSEPRRWIKDQGLWRSVGYGLALALMLIEILKMAGVERMVRPGGPGGPFGMHGPWVEAALIGVVWVWVVLRLLMQHNVFVHSRAGLLALGAALAVVGLSFAMPGLVTALLLSLLGFASGSRILLGLGLTALLGFIGHYYYQLHATLLVKSGILLGSGAVLLGARLALRAVWPVRLGGRPIMRKWIVALAGLVMLALVNVNIYQREQLLDHGRVVLLELAPVDPRSLMQGDYMALRFRIVDEATERAEWSLGGRVVVVPDANDVGRFRRLDDGTPLAAGEVALRYRVRHGQPRFATNAFFFQEGHAQLYEAARYGEFRVAPSGDMLLTRMRDRTFKVLGPPSH